MAVRAPIVEQRFIVRRADIMPRMTLQTEKRHGRIEQIVIDRTMWRMAGGTILGHIAVLEGKGTLLLHVAAGTEFLGGVSLEKKRLHGSMGIMAVNAGDFLLPDRMVGKEAVFCFNLRVASIAEVGGFFPGYLLSGAPVKLVAIETANVVEGVNTSVPVGQTRG